MYIEKMYKRTAKKISFYRTPRSLNGIVGFIVHGTGNKGDTARGNCDYYALRNTRVAGAHFYISRNGEIGRSIPIDYSAWAVGGNMKSGMAGEAKYYGKLDNFNTVSVEFCDALKGVSFKQLQAARELYLHLKKKCPNLSYVARHWDVNGKCCPSAMFGKYNRRWKKCRNYILNGYQYTAVVKRTAAARTSPRVANNKVDTISKGTTLKIGKIVGKWGKIVNPGPLKGKYVTLLKVKKNL